MFRVGSGFDVHRFAKESANDAYIVLAGVRIPHAHTLLAHSDGDVLSHALCDALLGAVALGDIGQHFPDKDPQYKGISSLALLKQVYALLRERGWRLGNADITVIAEQPKLAPYQMQMRESLANTLSIKVEDISIKATTSEGLGFTGRGEGIAVQAIVLVQSN
tara:strand:- start:586 stop:1074 length:489 start_codon:yes stop_codon:yes gene_type:complete